MVVSCRIASRFSETNRNLDIYLSADGLDGDSTFSRSYLHLWDTCWNHLHYFRLQFLVHLIRGCVFNKFCVNVLDNFILLGTYRYKCPSTGKVPFHLTTDMRYPGYQQSSRWGHFEDIPE